MVNNFQYNGLEVKIVRTAYRRTLSVIVKNEKLIRVGCGALVSQRKIIKFLDLNERWLSKSIEYFKNQKKIQNFYYEHGVKIPFLGDEFEINFVGANIKIPKIIIEKVQEETQYQKSICYVKVPFDFLKDSKISDQYQKAIELAFNKFYRKQAKLFFEERVSYWSKISLLFPKRISVRGQNTLWGSCGANKHINLNYKLMVFEPKIIDYVIVHEMAHLKHLNHSKSFWKLVEAIFPEYKIYQKELKKQQHKAQFLKNKSN